MSRRRMVIGFQAFCKVFKFGIMFGWQIQRSVSGGCGTRTLSPVFVRNPRCAVSSVIRRRVSSPNPFYTKRFAHYVGRRCRQATIKDIAQELNLDWDTVKTLEMQYMGAQLAKAGRPGPK